MSDRNELIDPFDHVSIESGKVHCHERLGETLKYYLRAAE